MVSDLIHNYNSLPTFLNIFLETYIEAKLKVSIAQNKSDLSSTSDIELNKYKKKSFKKSLLKPFNASSAVPEFSSGYF